ncbi:MAG: hypothetical protein GYA36_20805 [Veillonellaceae bacterium]|nr:hypothetical protein [Veillonellaceae bacterium]
MAWPADGETLVAELARFRRLALVEGGPGPALRLAEVLGIDPCRVGQRLAGFTSAPDLTAVQRLLDGERVLMDLDVLFEPALQLDPLALLREQARRVGGVVAVWPGGIGDGRATYSVAGRFDRYDAALADAIVLRAQPVVFPDDVPFTMERIP